MAAVTSVQTPRLWTTEEYLALPTDDERSELIYGEIVVSPGATHEHNDLAHELGQMLKRWARHHRLGSISFDIDMVLSVERHLVYRPDVLFVKTENESRRQRGRVFGPADLAVEVASPSDRPPVSLRKYADYERYGVTWYWILQPGENTSLTEYELVEGTYVCRAEISGSDWFSPGLFPGLSFRLPPLLEGDLKAAVKGSAKKLM